MNARPRGYPIAKLEAKITLFVTALMLIGVMMSGPWLLPTALYVFALCCGITAITWVLEWNSNRRRVREYRRMPDPYWPKPRPRRHY